MPALRLLLSTLGALHPDLDRRCGTRYPYYRDPYRSRIQKEKMPRLQDQMLKERKKLSQLRTATEITRRKLL